jgi:hypothetical protein
MIMLPGASSAGDSPIKFLSYALADENQGYWVEVVGIEAELDEDALLVQAVLNSFHITAEQGQRDD